MTLPIRTVADRREILAGLAAGGTLLAAAGVEGGAWGATGDEVINAFVALMRPETRGDMLAETALVVDSDAPFPMSRADHLEHIGFQRALWESREWAPYDLRVRRIADSAFVSAYLMERGKPKGAGFRLRPLYATAVFVRAGAGWRALSLHLGAIAGQITDISPG